ncbi:MAG: DNA-3-methyladenine glycosylase [Candidatus Bathyarchaeales archaeon]
MAGKVLQVEFYERDPALVARELLGKILMRRLNSQILCGKIVETEAYSGENDPASKAYKGRKQFNELMFMNVGKTFIYMVHGNWLLNIVAHPERDVGAVLLRAIEPLQGMEAMMKNRGVKDARALTNGPGKLTKALAINKKLNGLDVTKEDSELAVAESEMENFEICFSHRIRVKFDLPQKLRFYVKGNKFISKTKIL